MLCSRFFLLILQTTLRGFLQRKSFFGTANECFRGSVWPMVQDSYMSTGSQFTDDVNLYLAPFSSTTLEVEMRMGKSCSRKGLDSVDNGRPKVT